MLKLFLKKWIFVAAIIISGFIIAYRTKIHFFYFFFWLLVSILIFCWAWLALEFIGARLYITRKNIKKINEGDLLDLELVLQNKSYLPVFNPIIKDFLPCAAEQNRDKLILMDDLKASAFLKVGYSCLCPQRGRYRLGPLSVYLFDPFCLFFLKKVFPVYSEVYVYPKTYNIKEFPLLAKGTLPWFGINSTKSSGEDEEFFGTREYREGDPITRIHWLSSAKSNKLIVKQFQNQNFPRAVIVFNLEKDKNYGEGKNSVCEYIIKIAASVSKYLINKNVSLEIIAHIGEIVQVPFNKSQEHLDDILKLLTIAQAESRVSLAVIFEEFFRYIPNDTNLIVITLDEDWNSIPRALSFEKRNISLIPMILISSTFKDQGQASEKGALNKMETGLPAGALNFKPVFFSSTDNIEEVFTKSFK